MYPNLDDERGRKMQYASPAANDQGPCIVQILPLNITRTQPYFPSSEKRKPEIRLFSQAYTDRTGAKRASLASVEYISKSIYIQAMKHRLGIP